MSIKKMVGHQGDESPLDRAYKLMKRLQRLRGNRWGDNYASIRKFVGTPDPR